MKRYLKRLTVPMALIAAVWLLVPASSSAQVPLPLLSPTPTPTPSPSPSRTASPKPRSTPKPPADDGGTSGGGSGPSKPRTSTPTTKPGGATRPRPTVQPVEVREGIAAWIARPKSPSRTTTRLLELLGEIKSDGSPLAVKDMSRGFGSFPVLGYVWYQDDFGAPRYIPSYHPHAGTDLFAQQGTPVIATTDGVIMKKVAGPISGNALWLRAKGSRAYYFYGHLYAFEPGMKAGKRVRRGDVIGYVGSTGDAVGTPAHVHFEIHPTGSPDHAVNPKPHLDRWLTAAENRALAVLGFAPNGTRRAGTPPWAGFLGSLADVSAPPPFWTSALDGSTMFATVDLTLRRLLAGNGFTATPSDGADNVAFTPSTYDPTNPLGPLFGSAAHAE